MKFLAINTAGKSIEVAVYLNGEVFFDFEKEHKKASESLLPLIDCLLKKANTTLSELDFFSCCVGAGSFTGIRIGVVSTRAFADALNKRVVPLTYADILAYTFISTDKKGQNFAVITDAGNSLFYVALYTSERERVKDTDVYSKDEVFNLLNENKVSTIVCENALTEIFSNSFDSVVPYVPSGKGITDAVMNAFKKTGALDIEEIKPIYIRLTQAERDLFNAGKEKKGKSG